MCNIYQFKSRTKASNAFRAKVAAAAEELPGPVVRKTLTGVVVQAGGVVAPMRWGFRREFNPAINNTRAEKLGSPMWAAACRDRRCVIPMTGFWEWGPGPGGQKQAHHIRDPQEDWLWAAGIWEDDAEFGPCFSMITTAASPAMAALHDRMPAFLGRDAANDWLKGTINPAGPYPGDLLVEPCPSPLAGSGGIPQGELF